VNIIREIKGGRYPELESVIDMVDEQRNLAEMGKNHLGLAQASLGLNFYERLRTLGVEPQTLDDYIRMCERISSPDFPIQGFVNAAIGLCRFERLGKPYEDACGTWRGNWRR